MEKLKWRKKNHKLKKIKSRNKKIKKWPLRKTSIKNQIDNQFKQ